YINSTDGLYNYYFGAVDFLNFSINYMQNTGTDIQTFYNQFMTPPEGYDGEYDANFWDDPNLIFQQQTLPSLANFQNSYPGHSDPLYNTPERLYNAIGGQLNAIYQANPALNSNTCAARLSKALNYSGITIPNISGKTFKGNDDKYYFMGAANMISWMKKTFGTPSGTNHITHADAGANSINVPNLIRNKTGIYGLVPIDPSALTGFSATGHIDLINHGACNGGCYVIQKEEELKIYLYGNYNEDI
ncbi:T6SS effector amidase Tae4 family protein, partial [Mucilaginibacter sp.]|uniref:T6SS effector amidase Tae4 family protein n=1 Tax=Mucilaginibacter sp. TaxID=1882438 RepID=UPI00261FD8C7